MCLIAFAWQMHADIPLLVAANRDEWRDRAAEPAHWWPDKPGLLAGRDLQAGGTWLGLTRGGRFGAITNFRDPAERDSSAPSRGALLVDYFQGHAGPREYLLHLRERAGRYNAFNLLLADEDSLYYFGSREGEVIEVEPGVHALSNHLLDEPWPKVQRARMRLSAVLPTLQDDPAAPLFDLLSDTTVAGDAELPDTGVGLEWERTLAPILIRGERYGTLCSTVVARHSDGSIFFEERSRAADGAASGSAHFVF